MKIILALLLFTLAGQSAFAAENIDYSKLIFPQDARELIADRDRYFDSLEFHDDKVLQAVKRLYAVSLFDNIVDRCGEQGFWSNLKKFPSAAGLFLDEVRGNKDLDTAVAHSRHIRDALKHGAASIGTSDADELIAQGICDKM